MILSFQEQFQDKILSGTKKTTIRLDKGKRWRFGLGIEFYHGNPRNVNQNPYRFGTAICSYTKSITLDIEKRQIWVNGRLLTTPEAFELAATDGFIGLDSFFSFFQEGYNVEVFVGVLIGWHSFMPVEKGGSDEKD